MNNKSLSLINILLYMGMVVVDALANILPINGMKTGELSDMYPNLFVPAGMTFSIWGVIYALLLFMVIYQVVAVFGKKERFALSKNQGYVFALTCILNTAWILTWHYQQVLLSVIVMIGLLLCLISLYNGVFNAKILKVPARIAYRVTMNVYLGWISVATIANITLCKERSPHSFAAWLAAIAECHARRSTNDTQSLLRPHATRSSVGKLCTARGRSAMRPSSR